MWVLQLDTMAYRHKAKELEITRLPTLRWYTDGQPHNYTGRRDTYEPFRSGSCCGDISLSVLMYDLQT